MINTTNKRLALICWELNVKGGTQRQTIELARSLLYQGCHVDIYTVFYDQKKCYAELTKELNIIQLNTTQYELKFKKLAFLSGLKSQYRLYRMIPKNYDGYFINDYGLHLVALLLKKRLNTVPIVWQMNDLVIRRYQKMSLLECSVYWISLIYPIIDSFKIYAIKQTKNIIVIDNKNAEVFSNKLDLQVDIVRNGVEICQFKFKKRNEIRGKPKLFASGLFFPWRRYEDLIQALKILKDQGVDFDFVHVGSEVRSPDYAKTIYKMAETLGISNSVSFLGEADEKTLKKLYRDCDVYIFPNAPQTWGLAVFEAIASGAPTIVTSGCGASEVLKHNKTALITEPYSPESLALEITRLIETPSLVSQLSTGGRKYIENNLLWANYAKNILNKMFN